MSHISLLYDVLQKEINTISFHAVHFFRFVNHFYGCISVLEMLGQEEILGLIDIAHIPFANIGKEYGFFNEGSLAYQISNPEYEKIWYTIWKEVGEKHLLDLVDEIEEKTFIMVEKAEKARGLTFFKRALGQLALAPEQINIISDLLASSDIGLSSSDKESASTDDLGSQNESGIIKPELTEKESGMPEIKPEVGQKESGMPDVKPEVGQRESGHLEVQKLETSKENSVLEETKTLTKTVDLNKAASLIQKRFRKTRRHRAVTPMVHVTHKRVTAITHRKRRI